MKKEILIAILIALLSMLYGAPAGGTYRIYTCFATGDTATSWRVERIDTLPFGPKIADTVCQRCSANIWDDSLDGSSGETPLPWHKLYLRDNAYWISWYSTGKDTDVCPPESCGNHYYWYYSPAFKMYDNISRATIWFTVDDYVRDVRLRKIETGDTVNLGIPLSVGYTKLYRYDVTEIFRSCSEGSYDPSYRLEFLVGNFLSNYTGLMVYMSYDYGTPRSFSYRWSISPFHPEDTIAYISMPFYPTDTTVTLRSLFPYLYKASFLNPYNNVEQRINIDRHLNGNLLDTIRTYSIKLTFHSWVDINTNIRGYPVYEQRYLDMPYDYQLWSGSVIDSVKFGGELPDDYPDYKITGTLTYFFDDADSGIGDSISPTMYITNRYAYHINPRAMENSLPYSLDIYCSKLLSFYCEFYNNVYKDSIVEYEYNKSHFEELKLNRKYSLNITLFPSPFNSILDIMIKNNQTEHIMIKIYDILGYNIKNVYSGELDEGNYHFYWNGKNEFGNDVSSGIYLVEITTEKFRKCKKAILIK